MTLRLDLSPPPAALAPELDAAQRAVLGHEQGPLLVLAGPGTGKTTTIVEAIVARLHAGLPADAVLALTFGRKAAGELRDRVLARLGGGVAPTVATFHSFAYGLLRQTASAQDYLTVPRLLSGAEEDVRIRELLRGAVADGFVDWPADLAGALPTLGLAGEVRAVLSRARALGLTGADLQAIGAAAGRPGWTAAGQFAAQEDEVMALEDVVDYERLLEVAVNRLEDPAVAAGIRTRFRAIYVDEYQDTDPMQVALLRALAGPATSIVVVGDPDQSIYAFRGADVDGLLRFPDQFPTADGGRAPVVVLRDARRFGPRIRAAAAALLGPTMPARLPADAVRAHRTPRCVPPADPAVDDLVTVRTYDDLGSQAAHIAHELRQAHVQRGVPWSELAVLVRAGSRLPVLQRALIGAGVPVVVAADEVPLRAEPAVAALLTALGLVVDPADARPEHVLDVLTGPLGLLTAADVRRLGRALRARVHEEGYATAASAQLIRDLVVGAITDPPGTAGPPATPGTGGLPLAPTDPLSAAVERVVGVLAAARAQVVAGSGPADVLWTLWNGGGAGSANDHGWPGRLRAAALAGDATAGHDLDAVIALFDTAERMAGRYRDVVAVRMFLEALTGQQVPAEPVADRSTRPPAVRLLTAHRAKGLEWDEVWLVGLEEGSWPDLRPRGSTLRVAELTSTGIGPGDRPADLLAEERRLAFVAATRARRRLHVTAVDEPGEAGERHSRFLDDLAAAGFGAEAVVGRPPFPLTLDGLVAELRSVAVDPEAPPALRRAATERLAGLAAAVDETGRPMVPLADPATWWGLADVSVGAAPVRDPDRPVAISGSALDSIVGCPLKWFLEREASAQVARGAATGFGSIVHAVADFVAKGEVPVDLDAADEEVERVWSALVFEAPWQSAGERAEARAALARFLAYHERADRRLVGTEVAASAQVEVPAPDGGTDQVRLSGYIDRVELDALGRLVPIDLKNMRTPPRDADIPDHGQLGVYQVLLRDGDWRPPPDVGAADPPVSGGAALVQLRVDTDRSDPSAKVQFQPELTDQEPDWVLDRLGQAAAIVRGERFDAIDGPACRYCAFHTVCPAKAAGTPVVP